MSFYLDASVLVPLAVAEASSPAVEAFLVRHEGQILVSEFAAAEAASGVSRLVRMGQLTVADARAALEDLDTWRFVATQPVDVARGDMRLAHSLVRRFETKLRAADALHVAIAKRLGAQLVSRDDGMRVAAEMVGVAAANPG